MTREVRNHGMFWVAAMVLAVQSVDAQTISAVWRLSADSDRTDGDWTDGGRWSSNTPPINGRPNPGDRYDVLITDANYGNDREFEIYLGYQRIAVNSLRLDSPNATLVMDRSHLTVDGEVNLNRGYLVVDTDASFTDTRIITADANRIQFRGSNPGLNFYNVTFIGDLTINRDRVSISFQESMSLEGTVRLSGGVNRLGFSGVGMVVPDGTYILDNDAAYISIAGGEPGVTLGSDVIVTGFGAMRGVGVGQTLINNGTLRFNTPGKFFEIDDLNVINNGLIALGPFGRQFNFRGESTFLNQGEVLIDTLEVGFPREGWTNAGVIRLGEGGGRIYSGHRFIQEPSGSLEVTVSETTTGRFMETSNDPRFEEVTLAGELVVVIKAGSTIEVGDEFHLIKTIRVNSLFDRITPRRFGGFEAWRVEIRPDGVWLTATCYADCDQSGALDIFDFLCFQNSFVLAEPYACDCDPDPVCDIFDFLCFQNAFVAGCP